MWTVRAKWLIKKDLCDSKWKGEKNSTASRAELQALADHEFDNVWPLKQRHSPAQRVFFDNSKNDQQCI